PQDSYNLRADYGPSDFDVRQRFVLSGFYQLPFQNNRAVAGWQFAIITSAQTGNPLQPIFVSSTSAIFPGVNLRPNVSGSLGVTGGANVSGSVGVRGRQVEWFGDPEAFTSPCTTVTTTTTCSPGDMGRNSVLGPSFVNTDLSLIKDTKITERVNLQFRADAFD